MLPALDRRKDKESHINVLNADSSISFSPPPVTETTWKGKAEENEDAKKCHIQRFYGGLSINFILVGGEGQEE